jgi:hypothetical protein
MSIYKEINMTTILDPMVHLLKAADGMVGAGCQPAAPTLTPTLVG